MKPRHSRHFLPTGHATPSGNYTKRVRLNRSASPLDRENVQRPIKPIPARGEARKRKRSATLMVEEPEQPLQHPMPAMPGLLPHGTPALHPGLLPHGTPAMHHALLPHGTPAVHPNLLPPHAELGFGMPGPADPPNMGGFMHQGNQQGHHGVAPMYAPQFPPAPFGLQPPYNQHGGFHGPGYAPAFYQPPYGQQVWPTPQPNNVPHPPNAAQGWGGQGPYVQEEVDAMLHMRRGGGYGNN